MILLKTPGDKLFRHIVERRRRIAGLVLELRYGHAYDAPAYDSGLKNSQFLFAADMVWFY
jgi:hypothetical protein